MEDRLVPILIFFVKQGKTIFQIKLSLHVAEQKVCYQEYLRCGVD